VADPDARSESAEITIEEILDIINIVPTDQMLEHSMYINLWTILENPHRQ
jgi:hypothetical protein